MMVPTSSFPYQTQGPIDFSQLNFVKTEQIEHLDASGTLTSVDIKQTYDPTTAFLLILLLALLFTACTVFVAWWVSRRSKTASEAFPNVVP